jgi:hypothetical protein
MWPETPTDVEQVDSLLARVLDLVASFGSRGQRVVSSLSRSVRKWGSAKGIPDFVSDRRHSGLLNGLFDGAAIKPFFDG